MDKMSIELTLEALDYFGRAGDEGDKKYVEAIRAHIAELEAKLADNEAQVATVMRVELDGKAYMLPPAAGLAVKRLQERVKGLEARIAPMKHAHFRSEDPEKYGYVEGWNACRAAVLSATPAGEQEASK